MNHLNQPNIENSDSTLAQENNLLRVEVKKLNMEIKKLSREVRMSKSFLDKVTRASEAKDALGNALSAANARQRAYMDMLLEYCPNIIILLDEAGRFVLSTKAFLIATGIPNFDFIKNRSSVEVLADYFTKDSLDKLAKAFEETTTTGNNVFFDLWIDFSKTGNPQFYSIEFRRAELRKGDLTENKYGVLAVMTDLTEIIHEKEQAELANRAKSDFLAAMSHEIRTPMNAISGMSSILSREELLPKHQKYVSDIQKASDALLSIINDILDFSKIEAGKMEVININYSLEALLDNLKSMFSEASREKNLDMQFIIDDSLPMNVYGDDNKLRQILTNLLSNAFKYTKEGSVVLSAWLDEKNNLRFDIKDTGIGIQKKDISKLFLPFEQMDKYKNRNIAGTGLGLAIVSSLCNLMNGEIWAISDYGKGSTFSLSIPYSPIIESATDIQVVMSEFVAPGAKVLVVDDIEINLLVAELMLEIFEIAPDKAESGKEAIEMAKNKEYDLIFMDHMMPELDGVETTQIIRDLSDHYSKIPIVALTANAIKGTEQMFINNRLDDVLPKPMEIMPLNLCLRKWLPQQIIEEGKE